MIVIFRVLVLAHSKVFGRSLIFSLKIVELLTCTTISSSGFEKRVNSPLNRSRTSPVAPLRCLAIITSAIPRRSFLYPLDKLCNPVWRIKKSPVGIAGRGFFY